MNDIDECIERVKNLKILDQRELKALLKRVKEILVEESNVVQVRAPVIVAGDIHGQFYDLLKLFELGGQLPHSNYVFLGDFVDRGVHSVETITLLFLYKCKYPSHITLLRGNHETRDVCFQYGFMSEIKKKYGTDLPWNLFNDTFDYLPVAATIENDIFCVHGGLSPGLKTIDQIRLLDRVGEVPTRGPYSDLLWSDPMEGSEDWRKNARGAGWMFGHGPVREFNHANGTNLIARAHQLVQEGYQFIFDDSLVTVWSAPNYTYRCGNKASIMKIDAQMEYVFELFDSAPKSGEVKNLDNILPYFL
jgi:diadenosine tetraphosphatase ApaH/serine/threonine PP2A family protein phosphatase